METSVWKKVHDVLLESEGVKKTGQMQGAGSYAFHSIDDVQSHLRPLFQKHGLVLTTDVVDHEHRQDGGGRGLTIKTVACVITCADTGHQIEGREVGYGIDGQDKGPGKATSYAVKTWLLNTFMLKGQPDEDVLGRFDDFIDDDQQAEIEQLLVETSSDRDKFLKVVKANAVSHIKKSRYHAAIKALEGKK